MAGGVFWVTAIIADDQEVKAISTGLFMTLSIYLYESTRNETYRTAAILSSQWIEAHVLVNSIVLDSVNAHTCNRSSSILSYNTGKYLEGLGTLFQMTGDTHWKTLMENVNNAAVKNTAWEGSDGIITEGSETSSDNDNVGYKGILVRGVRESFVRNHLDDNLAPLAIAYINVQYNAVLDLAANGSSYSTNWHGPPPQTFTTWNQLPALDVLVSAVVANN